jgi:hypothetical protein
MERADIVSAFFKTERTIDKWNLQHPSWKIVLVTGNVVAGF